MVKAYAPSSESDFLRDLTKQWWINFSENEGNIWRGEDLRKRKWKKTKRKGCRETGVRVI